MKKGKLISKGSISTLLFLSLSLASWSAHAGVRKTDARVYTGFVDPSLKSMGALVTEKGEVLYVGNVISVLAPVQLKSDCWYSVSYTKMAGSPLINLVPPQEEVSCGHDFPADR